MTALAKIVPSVSAGEWSASGDLHLIGTDRRRLRLSIPSGVDAHFALVAADNIALACLGMLHAAASSDPIGIWCTDDWHGARVTPEAMAAVHQALTDPRVMAMARWRAAARGWSHLLETAT